MVLKGNSLTHVLRTLYGLYDLIRSVWEQYGMPILWKLLTEVTESVRHVIELVYSVIPDTAPCEHVISLLTYSAVAFLW